ncbi:LacI family DNA-binding transcriptional regulator [Lutibacter sp.]
MKIVTLKQIAEELNLSITTVSKALKGYPDVSKKTKQRVLDLAENLRYIPNSFAVSLRMKQSKTIGVIVPANVHHFFSNVIKGILKEAEKKDYLVILLHSNENFELEKKQVDLLISKGVDGILISLSNKTHNFEHLKKIIDHNIPLILFDKIAKIVNCSKVIINDKKAAYEAVVYLIKKGHKRIAHFRGDLNPQNSIDRFLGYKQALLDYNIEFDPSLVYVCDNNSDFEDGYNNAKKLLKDHGKNIDAIFTITDVIAMGIIKYFNTHNIKIPEDIALFGFSNWFMSSVINPSLSTVEQHGYEMGEKSAHLLFHEIECKQQNIVVKPQIITLPTELVIRESS